jgi:hypothetical protein
MFVFGRKGSTIMTARINKVDGGKCGSIEGIPLELQKAWKDKTVKLPEQGFLARISALVSPTGCGLHSTVITQMQNDSNLR